MAHHETHPAWFVVPLRVPDAWLAEHADPPTLAQWARLTGRGGAPDRYWFPETWDRFLEPGRRIGLARGERRLAPAPWAPGVRHHGGRRRVTGPTLRPGHPPSNLTPDLERGVGVPPGYALVECGRLSVGVVVDRERVA